MHIHVPKPLHGWRVFAGEVGIIVIGVLLALGAEQVVEEVHWRHTIEAEQSALDTDVADMWNAMTARVVMQPCVDNRLNELALVFRRHEHGQPLGIIGRIGRPGVWNASTNALRMASADQSLSHMSAKTKRSYFDVESSYEIFSQSANEERNSWRVLQTLDDPASLTDEDWRNLRLAYRNARDSNTTMKFNLVVGLPGQWLTPFKPFLPLPQNTEAPTVPVVHDLCGPAVKTV
jgi:hypothetical protein